jgi:acetyl/propionyl-CoA carboxylase alpha subunit
MDAFVYALGEQLASVGYTVELHRALMLAQEFFSKDVDGKFHLDNIESVTQKKDEAQKSQSSSSHGSSKLQMDATVKQIETATQKNEEAQKSQSSSSCGNSKLQMDAPVSNAARWTPRRRNDEAQESQSSSSHGSSKLQMDAPVKNAQRWMQRRSGPGAEEDEAQKRSKLSVIAKVAEWDMWFKEHNT